VSSHYQDYLKKSISVRDLVYDKVEDSDRGVIKRIRKAHIKANVGGLVILGIAFAVCLWLFINFLLTPGSLVIYQIMSLTLFGGAAAISAYYFYHIIGAVKGIRRGVLLASSREQENKDGRNSTYQYLFDIYMEDRDETLMSFPVDLEVFKQVRPGDGVFIVKVGRKAKVMEDPDRKAVMDVSTVKSGV
jgi:hypothetical protein